MLLSITYVCLRDIRQSIYSPAADLDVHIFTKRTRWAIRWNRSPTNLNAFIVNGYFMCQLGGSYNWNLGHIFDKFQQQFIRFPVIGMVSCVHIIVLLYNNNKNVQNTCSKCLYFKLFYGLAFYCQIFIN